jgi:hypothetical protein
MSKPIFDPNTAVAVADKKTSDEFDELVEKLNLSTGKIIVTLRDKIEAVYNDKKLSTLQKNSRLSSLLNEIDSFAAGFDEPKRSSRPTPQQPQPEPATPAVATPEPAAAEPINNGTTEVETERPRGQRRRKSKPSADTPKVAEPKAESTGEKLVRETTETLETDVEEVKKSHEVPKTDDKPAETTKIEITPKKVEKSRRKRFFDALKK